MNKPKPYAFKDDGKTWPMVSLEISELAYELRHGSSVNLALANIIDAYIELVTCSPRKRRYIIKKIRYYSNIINQGIV